MNKKTFVTIFPICENVHLTKDLGQIPYFLHKVYGYDSKMVCYKNNESYPNIDGEVKGLKIDFLKNTGKISFIEKAVFKYIYKNGKEIDILNLYIYSKHSFVYGLLYKFVNPKGYLYLKLDGYNETFEKGNKIRHSTKFLKNIVLKYVEKLFLEKVDLITIENSEGETLVKNKFPNIKNKIMYLPVGVNDFYLKELFGQKVKTYAEKENIILTTGRIGEWIKNHEMILKALTKVDIKNWKMVFIGPVNIDFIKYFNAFVKDFPELSNRILFTGQINDRKEIYEWYNRSKIFCMTSRKESFCHAISEALYFGNYIVGTEGIMSMKDVSNEGRYGITLKNDDDDALSTVLQRLIDDQSFMQNLYPSIISHSKTGFVWSEIINQLQNKIVQTL